MLRLFKKKDEPEITVHAALKFVNKYVEEGCKECVKSNPVHIDWHLPKADIVHPLTTEQVRRIVRKGRDDYDG